MKFELLRNRHYYVGQAILAAVAVMWLATGFQTCLAGVPDNGDNGYATALTTIQHQVSRTSECPASLCQTIAETDGKLTNSNKYKWTNLKHKTANTTPTYLIFNPYNTTARKQSHIGLADFTFPHPNTLYNVLRI